MKDTTRSGDDDDDDNGFFSAVFMRVPNNDYRSICKSIMKSSGKRRYTEILIHEDSIEFYKIRFMREGDVYDWYNFRPSLLLVFYTEGVHKREAWHSINNWNDDRYQLPYDICKEKSLMRLAFIRSFNHHYISWFFYLKHILPFDTVNIIVDLCITMKERLVSEWSFEFNVPIITRPFSLCQDNK